ncbi:MAG: sulfate ABC transporter ATP-binding protein [Gloeocapsa sp. DLM2.Bin57]|nr:MAG: sulfate ABC transporter ATP-binding protein [Gloeocapsa sp. DLM2.Bin57]
MTIVLKNVSKKFGNFQALKNINLTVGERQLVALLGPSGSGKSTLLRMISGLERPDQGQILINHRNATHLDIRQRNIGFVFQHYALFKHLTVRQNIAFGLEIRKKPAAQIKRKVDELLELIQLEGYGNRYPAQLSGGQRQRVALARALIVQPQVLLLDEPFGALDAKVRKELRSWLRKLHDEVHITSVFVTHDQEEAMEVADQIVIMNQGSIEQVGSSAEIYDNPATPFVMQFIGEVNVLPSHAHLFNGKSLQLPNSEVFVRPHELMILLFNDGESTEAKIQRIIHLGREVQVELLLPDTLEVTAHVSKERYEALDLQPGMIVYVKPSNTKHFSDPILT